MPVKQLAQVFIHSPIDHRQNNELYNGLNISTMLNKPALSDTTPQSFGVEMFLLSFLVNVSL